MVLDDNFLYENSKIIKSKIAVWEEITKLKFDNDGRVLIGKMKCGEFIFNDFLEYFSGDNSIKNISESFIKSFNDYLADNNLEIYISSYKTENVSMLKKLDKCSFEKVMTNCYRCFPQLMRKVNKIENPEDISFEMLFLNSVKVSSKYGIHKVKLTKILASVQKYWEKDNPEYKEIKIKLRDLTGKSEDERNYLKKRKLELEKNNLYFDLQKLLNKSYLDGGELWLSINPIDEFTISGAKYGDKEYYPTNFTTCIRNEIKIINGNISIDKKSVNSNPMEQFLLGKIKNKGILYIKNGNRIKTTNVELFGYKLRGAVWLDKKSIFIPKWYPSLSKHDEDYIFELIQKKVGINVSGIVNSYKFEFQDVGNNKILYDTIYENTNCIFIDYICIRNNEIYMSSNCLENTYFKSMASRLKFS